MVFKPQFSIVILLALTVFVTPYRTYGQLMAIRKQFVNPPDKYKPGVYWYFMDGNMNTQSIKKDLEAMKSAGIGSVLFLEVNVGIPRGNVDFLSDSWYSLLGYAIREAKQLGITVSLGIGPGWQGSGGPWVKASQSMQLLVASETTVSADDPKQVVLPVPDPPKPFFGEGGLPGDFKKARSAYYEDVTVLAFPEQENDARLNDYQAKALFYRAPYSSGTVVPFLSPVSGTDNYKAIPESEIINLTDKMDHDGKLNWHPKVGKWLVMRFVSRNNGAITRPAPVPGLGFESDKLDTAALKMHLDAYIGKILKYIGPDTSHAAGGLKTLHMDSWEAGSQNWTQKFREEFIKRRGYDPLKYFPAYYGHVVETAEKTERFLWDVRQTAQELVFENHAGYVKKYAKARGFNLSIEPYDMNPTSDLDLGSIADVPMAEFWSKGFGFNSSYSVIEATSIGHILGKPVIQSESFTAQDEGWKQYPGSMKNQGDWALAAGINKFFFHTFENQFLPDSLRPGATMGPYGVHWDRNQTWWPMVGAYHTYLARCQYVLQQGRPVADILYLTPEGAPDVFVPPLSAIKGDSIGDRKGFNFDGCTGNQLMRATVSGHTIQFPGGAQYKVLVLPSTGTITPELLAKIETLVKAGAVIVGKRPLSSPSLVNYPACDEKVAELGKKIWGNADTPEKLTYSKYGEGTVVNGGEADKLDGKLYPYYETVASILKNLNYTEDFTADGPVRYTHRTSADWDIYFVSNTTTRPINFKAGFHTTKGAPEIWDAVTGKVTRLSHFTRGAQQTSIPLKLHAYESCFVVFSKDFKWKAIPGATIVKSDTISKLNYNWDVSFDPKWGGPKHTEFKELKDWTQMPDQGIKYYSGIATYTKTFTFNGLNPKNTPVYLDLDEVKNMARVTLNGKDIGVVWTAPWRIDITAALRRGNNILKVEVANLWINRLIGDEKLPYDGPKDGKWPEWLLNGQPRPGKRYTFTTTSQYSADSPLQASGLLGPVSIVKEYVVTP
jgi:hypothetical protein